MNVVGMITATLGALTGGGGVGKLLSSVAPGLGNVQGGGEQAGGKGDQNQVQAGGQPAGIGLNSLFGGGGGGFLLLLGSLVGIAKQFFPGASEILGAVENGLSTLGGLLGKGKGEAETPEETATKARDTIEKAKQVPQTATEITDMIGKMARTPENEGRLRQVTDMMNAVLTNTPATPPPAPTTAEGWQAEIKRLQEAATAALR